MCKLLESNQNEKGYPVHRPDYNLKKFSLLFELSRLTAFAFSHLFTYATQVLRAEKKEEIQNEGCRVQNTLEFGALYGYN